ncbi:hypothetical protein Cme02nite_08250 [Catellatospora methionotrophica]|uniref:Uncharacterized protein n=1 Tax=Catellatospora methionotrophica TaxID=121620 RepID=A0A8J3L674_9ACTN|nr:hypothetical protein [Catellatospora methionotrophica]GIG12493.1 hypothetical protein Cme02nite_08250 [Catellatospora methionotrophica]
MSAQRNKALPAAIVLFVLAAVGVAADLAGLVSFSTGLNFPDFFDRPQVAGSAAPTAVTSPAPVGRPARTTAAAKPATPGAKTVRLSVAVDPGSWESVLSFKVTVRNATPGGQVAVEVILPGKRDGSGACPKLTAGPCAVAYADNYVADAAGVCEIYFPWEGGGHEKGWYDVVAYDDRTGRVERVRRAFEVY